MTKMKLAFPVALLFASQAFFSCQKTSDAKTVQQYANIPNSVIEELTAKGFSTDGIEAVDGGYLVEGDLFFSAESLNKTTVGPNLVVGQEEQYRTTLLVTGLPKIITISNSYPSSQALFNAATDSVVARYNKLGLRLAFKRVPANSGADIDIIGADLGGGGVLGRSSGFPDASGNPASPITLNSRKGTFSNNTDVQWLATVIAHEVGHTIGMRHTDYANRKYSCGIRLPGNNEGQAGVGAIYIPGTNSTPKDPGSWMLACTDGTDRPFNANDVIALSYLYK